VQKLDGEKALRHLKKNIRFTETREGLRIDLIDEADFAMFSMATDRLLPEARQLLSEVAKVIADVPNDVIVRGHTDGLPYGTGRTMNNWLLSSARAEATRVELARQGVGARRFLRIEGVADRDPYVPQDPYDPRNRRMSVVLAWSEGLGSQLGGGQESEADPTDTPENQAAVHAAILARDNPRTKMQEIVRRSDMGHTSLPDGAVISNAASIPKRTGQTPPGKTDATAKKPAK